MVSFFNVFRVIEDNNIHILMKQFCMCFDTYFFNYEKARKASSIKIKKGISLINSILEGRNL